jgi:O-antigen ligase
MQISRKQIKAIEKLRGRRSAREIAGELGIGYGTVCRVLGLRGALWSDRLRSVCGWLMCALLLMAPFVFIKGLSDFADLPQRVFVQLGMLAVLAVCLVHMLLKPVQVSGWGLLDGSVALFGVYPFGLLFFTANNYEGVYAALHWGACAAAYFVVRWLAREDRWVDRIVLVVCCAGAGVVGLGLLQQFLGFAGIPMVKAPAAVFANPNMAAEYLVMVAPLFLLCAFRLRTVFAGATALLLFVPALIVLWYTGCRAAWLALVASGLWFAICMYGPGRCAATYRRAALMCVLAVIGAGMFVLASGGTGKLARSLDGSAHYRLTIWQNSLTMFAERPVRGFGPGTFKIYYPGYTYAHDVDRAFDKTTQIRRAHNDYLQMAVELGAAGPALLALMLGCGLYMALRLAQRATVGTARMIPAGISAGIVACMVTAFFSFPLQRANTPLLLCVYLGIVSALWRRYGGGFSLQVPRRLAATALAAVAIAGIATSLFHVNNIQSEKHFHRAVGYEKKGLNRQARAAAREAHAWNRSRMDVLVTLGRAHATTGDYTEAIQVLEQAVRMHPYNLNGLFILGAACANAGDTARALEVFGRVLHIKPDFAEAQKIIAVLKSRGTVTVHLK